MISHRAPISGVAAFGNQWVATAGYDNQVIVWDGPSKQPLARAFHDHLANQVSFSPDGRHLLSTSSDHTARLWCVPSLKLKAVFADHLDDVEMAAFHPTRELVATASRDHCVRVYDFSAQLQACFEGHTADAISVAWSADGSELISSSDDGTVKRWSLDAGTLLENIDLGGVETDTVAVTADGVIYAGNDEGEIAVIRDGRTSRIAAHDAGIKRLVYDPATRLMVSLSYDRSLRVWHTCGEHVQPVAKSEMPAEIWPRSCAFIDPDTLAFATFGSSFAVYHIDTGSWDLAQVLPTAGVNAVAVALGRRITVGDSGSVREDGRAVRDLGSLCNFLTPAGSRVFTGGQMGEVRDALSGELLYQHRSPLNCAATFLRSGRIHVVVGTYTGEGLVFSVSDDGQVRHEATLPLHANAVKSVAVSADMIFAVCADTAASWFAVEDFRELARRKAAHNRIANGCAPLPGGRFASVSRDLKLRIWGADFHAEMIATPHDRSIKCVATDDSGRFIATGSYSGRIAIYDVVNAVWRRNVRPTMSGISSLCFDSEGQHFLAGSYDGQVYEIAAA